MKTERDIMYTIYTLKHSQCLQKYRITRCADMMSMTSIETKHIVNKGFHNLKNPFFASLAKKNEYSMKGKINHMSVAFYVAPYVNAICRSGTIEQKTIVFKSMLKHEAFKEVLSTKRGHLLGEKEQLVEQAMRVVTNVKNRSARSWISYNRKNDRRTRFVKSQSSFIFIRAWSNR